MNTVSEDIRRELAAGERIRWSGRPRQGLALRPSDALAIPFSLVLCAGAIFWEYKIIRSNSAPMHFLLLGIAGVAIGLYVVVGRFFVEAYQRSKTFYAVTNERILIVTGLFSRTVNSLNIKTLSDVSLTVKPSGEGTVFFGAQRSLDSDIDSLSNWSGSSQSLGPRFELIADAKSVFDVIRKSQSGDNSLSFPPSTFLSP
jgi:hypothetical protein